jgi:hypothetical protein
MKKSKNCPGNNHIFEYLLKLRLEGDRKFVPGVVRAPGIFEDDFHGATTPGTAEIKKLIAVVGIGDNYLPVPMSGKCQANKMKKLKS